ncbi:MAG: SLC13 family permease, partial [Rhodospirillaceae bacterium]|nr:SLC13 family permease [Rhodospirillaceae bacterium]
MTADLASGAANTMQMWAAFALILGALALYVSERLSIEVTSVGVICILIVFFQLFPVIGVDGRNVLSAERLLLGFANPALITVLALLVVGQGMVRTGALDRAALVLLKAGAGSPLLSVGIVMVVAMLISGVLNNIPVVVIFIPVIQMLADKLDRPASKMMMGLSFTAVLGGSVTLIGSGSNLLVSSALIELGYKPFDFFDFTVPGLVLAAAGVQRVAMLAFWHQGFTAIHFAARFP